MEENKITDYYKQLDESKINEYVIYYCRNHYFEIFPELLNDIIPDGKTQN